MSSPHRPPCSAPSASPPEVWSTFTQVITNLQECAHRSIDSPQDTARAPVLSLSSPPAPPQRHKRPRADVADGRSDPAESSAVPTSSPPVPWSAEWVMMVWLRAILLCPLCHALLRRDALVIDPCGHCFCAHCLLPVIEDGCGPLLKDAWPYNAVLFDVTTSVSDTESMSLTEGSTTTTMTAQPATVPDLVTLGVQMADRLHRWRVAQRHEQNTRPPRRRARKVPFVCPLCGGPAFKWTTMRLPLIEDVCEALAQSVPQLEARLQALEEPREVPALSAAQRNAVGAVVEVISVSSDTSLPTLHGTSDGDGLTSRFASTTSVKPEPQPDSAEGVRVGEEREEEDNDLRTTQRSSRPPTSPFSVPLFVAPPSAAHLSAPPASSPDTPAPPSVVLPAVPQDASSVALLGALDDEASNDILTASAPEAAVPAPVVPQTTTDQPRHGVFRDLLYSDTP